MAVPERRVRGWWLVLLLVVLGLVVAVTVVVLRPTPRLGPPVLLVLAEDTISASPANASVVADFGPHCSKWRWDERRGHLTVEADVAFGGVDGLVLQHFTLGTPSFVTTGGDFLRATLHRNGTAWRLVSPVDGAPLLPLAASDGTVVVGNATHAPGDSWTMTFSYDVDTPQGTVRITEVIAFRNVGIVSPRIVPVTACA